MPFKLDANHLDIVKAFEQLGCKVIDNAKVKRAEAGQLDIWVGFSNPYEGEGRWVYVEIKTETGQLTTSEDGNSQTKTVQDCLDRGLPVAVVRSTFDVEVLYHFYLSLMRQEQFNSCPGCNKPISINASICDECIPF